MTAATGTIADVVAELRLQGLAADAMGERSIFVRGTALGTLLLWSRRDPASFGDAMSYPRPRVPVVDVELWRGERPHPRVLLVASATTRTILVCSPKQTQMAWTSDEGVSVDVRGRGRAARVWTCPRERMQPLSWLKRHLLGGPS